MNEDCGRDLRIDLRGLFVTEGHLISSSLITYPPLTGSGRGQSITCSRRSNLTLCFGRFVFNIKI